MEEEEEEEEEEEVDSGSIFAAVGEFSVSDDTLSFLETAGGSSTAALFIVARVGGNPIIQYSIPSTSCWKT